MCGWVSCNEMAMGGAGSVEMSAWRLVRLLRYPRQFHCHTVHLLQALIIIGIYGDGDVGGLYIVYWYVLHLGAYSAHPL